MLQQEESRAKTPPISLSFLCLISGWYLSLAKPTRKPEAQEALGVAHLGQTHRAESRQSRCQVDLRANEEKPAGLGKAFWDNKMVKLGGNPSLIPLTIPGICPPLGYKAPSMA